MAAELNLSCIHVSLDRPEYFTIIQYTVSSPLSIILKILKKRQFTMKYWALAILAFPITLNTLRLIKKIEVSRYINQVD